MRFIVRFLIILLFFVFSLIIISLYKKYDNIRNYKIEKDPIIQILKSIDIQKIIPEENIKNKYGLRSTLKLNRYERLLINKNASISNEMAVIILVFILTVIIIFMGIICIVIASLTSEKEKINSLQNYYKSLNLYDKEACFEKTKLLLENFKNDFEEEFLPEYAYHSHKLYTGINKD
uniref:Ion_trans domain-containing protein n=1 Tax=Strongyloides stercoralis TaxID=6248 RepID=A0A0K0E1Y8_STRER